MDKLLCTELNEEVKQKLLLELGEEDLAKTNPPIINLTTNSDNQSINKSNNRSDHQSNTIHIKL